MEPLNVSIDECAQLLGYGKTTTKRLIATGKILSYREGRHRVVPLAAIREYQAQRVADAHAALEADADRLNALDWSVPPQPPTPRPVRRNGARS